MTPTLLGRWQSRLFIMSTVGAFVTLLFGLAYDDVTTVFAVLGYVLVIGLLLDIPYHYVIQRYRWDGDWPPAYVFFSGVLELIVFWVLLNTVDLPGIPTGLRTVPGAVLGHYSAVWLSVFVMLFGGMRLLFPRWRFQGGRIGNSPVMAALVIWAVVIIIGPVILFSGSG